MLIRPTSLAADRTSLEKYNAGNGMDLIPTVFHIRHIRPGDADMFSLHALDEDRLAEALTDAFFDGIRLANRILTHWLDDKKPVLAGFILVVQQILERRIHIDP